MIYPKDGLRSLYLKIYGDIKHLNSCFLINWNLGLSKKWYDHFWDIPRLVVFGVNCFNCDTTKLYLRNNPAWNKDDIFSFHLIRMCDSYSWPKG